MILSGYSKKCESSTIQIGNKIVGRTAVPQLVCFDLDGTLLPVGKQPNRFASMRSIADSCEKNGVLWGIATGKTKNDLLSILEGSALPIQPHFLICLEREIYARRLAHLTEATKAWNAYVESELQLLFRLHGAAFRKIFALPALQSFLVTDPDSTSPGLIANDASMIDAILRSIIRPMFRNSNVGWQVNLNTIRFGHSHFCKGVCVRKLSELLHLTPESVATFGDGLNDLSMLNPDCAALVGCPADAHPKVLKRVAGLHGLISKIPGPTGMVEVVSRILYGQ